MGKESNLKGDQLPMGPDKPNRQHTDVLSSNQDKAALDRHHDTVVNILLHSGERAAKIRAVIISDLRKVEEGTFVEVDEETEGAKKSPLTVIKEYQGQHKVLIDLEKIKEKLLRRLAP